MLSYLRRDGRVVEGATLEMLCRGNSTVGSNPTFSAIFFAKKMANEDASLLFTVQSTTSLKRRSLFFTSSPSRREALLVKSLPVFACEDIRFALL